MMHREMSLLDDAASKLHERLAVSKMMQEALAVDGD
jgi:hypothetical protein